MLFITPELPYPPYSGGKIKSWNLVNYLQDNYELSVATILKANDKDYLGEFKSKINVNSLYSQSVNKDRTLYNLVKSYIERVPLNVHRTYSKSFSGFVSSTAHNYDVIFVDHYEAFQYIPENYKGQVVLHEHNAYYVLWERFAQSKDQGYAYRIASYFESLRVKRYEAKVCKRSDLVFAAPNDIEKLVAIGVDKNKCNITYHLGDDKQLDLPSLKYEDTDMALMYMGHLQWEANVGGLIWFFDNVWSGLKVKYPELKFYILGKDPDKRLIQVTKDDEDIIFTGFIENPEEYFIKSRIFVAPLRFGSGIKVKVLNAMCRGIPTVTTSVGVEGLKVKHMEHIAVADSAESMLQVISELLTARQSWENMSENSRVLIQDLYTWNIVFSSMKIVLDQVLSGKSII